MSYKTELQANNADIRALIEQAKALPDAGSGGVELPELTDPAEENDVRAGKEYIDATGAKAYGRLFMDTVLTPGWEARIPVEVQYDSDDRYLVMKDGSAFGNATPADVGAGVTFTSREGVALVGTMVPSGGAPSYEACTVQWSDAGNGFLAVYTNTSGEMVAKGKVNGEDLTMTDVAKGTTMLLIFGDSTYTVEIYNCSSVEEIDDTNLYVYGIEIYGGEDNYAYVMTA